MGTAIVVFHKAGNRSNEYQSMPVARLPGSVSQVITTSTTSAQTTAAAASNPDIPGTADGGFATVFAVDVNLWVASGPNPTAVKPGAGVQGSGFPIMSGSDRTFAVAEGDKIALIEWT